VRVRVVLLGILVLSGRAWAQDAATQQLLQEADRYYDQGDYERAASNYDRAIRAQPKDVPAAAYAKRASIFLFAKSYDEGLRWIGDVAEKSWPDDDLVLEQKAVILSRIEGRKKDAVELAEHVVARRASAYTLQTLLGDYYYQLGAGSAAKTADHYEAYLKYRPGDIASQDGLVRVKLGFADLHLGRYAEAERQLDEALRSFSADVNIAANARKGLCAAYAGVGNWDRALTLCERVLEDKHALRGDPSPQYNAGLAYLNRDRLDEALKSADAYIVLRPKEPKGYLLRGEVYIRRNRLVEAETQLNQAETIAPNDGEVARELGRVYLKQKRAAKAIDKLTRAATARPNDVETVTVLAEAYLADGQGPSAATQAERGLKLPGQDKNTRLMALAGEGYYVAGQLPTARAVLERAIATAKATPQGQPDARVRALLVDTINRQAAARFAADDIPGTEKLLAEAKELDPTSTRTSFNLGLVAVHKGDYAAGLNYLNVRYQRTPSDLLTNRLMAKAYLSTGNEAKALEHYTRAAAEATARRNLAVLAEIYTEWAPLLIKGGKLDDAIDKLEQATQYARAQPFERATKRNLALAYFRRGYDKLRSRRGGEAVNDLEGALKDPSVLAPGEKDVYGFALGLAYLDAGQAARATALFTQASQAERKGGNLPFLKPPFDAIGGDFFAAYTQYRDGSPGARLRATALLEKLVARTGGGLGAKVKELLRSTWEYSAYDAYQRGQVRDAEAALKKAAALATPDKRAPIEHNQAVLDIDRNAAAAKAVIARLTDRVPEALVNLGILAERDGDAKAAYDSWTAARSRGARTPKLEEWIDTKKRLFGF
jgi:tetratricopeptide (TPR) repeat protein